MAALELLQPYLVKMAIDDYILRREWSGLGRVAALFLAVLVALYFLRVLQAYLTQVTGQRVMRDLRNALFRHLQRLDARFFDRNPVGRLMTRVLNDVEAIHELFTSGIVAVVGDVFVLTGVVVIMLGMNWRLALVTFALVPLLALAAGYFRLCARDAYRAGAHAAGPAERLPAGVAPGHVRRSSSSRARIESATIFAGLNADLRRRAQFRSTLYDVSLYATVEAIGSAAIALLIWYGGGEVVRERAHVRRPRRVPRVHQPLLPAHPRPRGEVHGDAGGHGVLGARVRAA